MGEGPDSYEDAVARLEQIIDWLDSGQAGLRETLDLSRRGRSWSPSARASSTRSARGSRSCGSTSWLSGLGRPAGPRRRLRRALRRRRGAAAGGRRRAGQSWQSGQSGVEVTSNSPAPMRRPPPPAARGRSRCRSAPSRLWPAPRGLEEDVGEADSVGPGRLCGGDRVDVSLDPVVGRPFHLGSAFAEAVRLVVGTSGALERLREQVDGPAHDRPPEREQQRHLRPQPCPRPRARRRSDSVQPPVIASARSSVSGVGSTPSARIRRSQSSSLGASQHRAALHSSSAWTAAEVRSAARVWRHRHRCARAPGGPGPARRRSGSRSARMRIAPSRRAAGSVPREPDGPRSAAGPRPGAAAGPRRRRGAHQLGRTLGTRLVAAYDEARPARTRRRGRAGA